MLVMRVGGAVQAARPRLLLTEDEPLMRQAMTQFFDARGYDVVGAGSLADSRAQVATQRFDAFVVDVGLPDGDGLDLVDSVSPERAVVISAAPEPERYARASIRHALTKPVDLEVLGRAVEEVLAASAIARTPAVVQEAVVPETTLDVLPRLSFAGRLLEGRPL